MLKYFGQAPYLHLNGDPVDRPKILRPFLRPAFLAAALTTTAFCMADKENKNLAYHLSAMLVAAGCVSGIARLIGYLENQQSDKRIYINTRPTEEELAASFKNSLKMEEFSRQAGKICLKSLGGFAPSALMYASYPGLASAGIITSVAFTGVLTNHFYNINKVAKGEWAIVDEPPKDKAVAHLKAEKKAPAPAALPTPQGV